MARVIMIVNDCNNNGYKILLKQVVDVIRKCRLIKDIEDKFAELEHNETGEQIHCVVCKKKVLSY